MDIRSFFGGNKASPSSKGSKSSSSPSQSKTKQPQSEKDPRDDEEINNKRKAPEDLQVANKIVVREESVTKRVQVKKDQADQEDQEEGEGEGEGEPVPYKWVSDAFDAIDATTKRLEIQEILSKLFSRILDQRKSDLLAAVYMSCNQVGPSHHGLEIGVGDSVLTKAITNVTGRTKKAINDKYEEDGDLGKVAMTFKSQQKTLFGQKPKALSLQDVFQRVRKVASTSSQDQKQKLIEKLLVNTTGSEVKFVVRFLQGKLRIGLAEQTVLIALAYALCNFHYKAQMRSLAKGEQLGWSVTAEVKEQAVNTLKQVNSELPVYDEILAASLEPTKPGEMWFDTLRKKCHIAAGVPLKPMLAKPTNGISEVLNRFQDTEFTCEYKYDGERAQIHMTLEKDAHGVEKPVFKIYSRNLEDNTKKYPDIIEDIQSCFSLQGENKVTSFIMDTEAVAYDVEQATLLPFQILSTRARKDVDAENVKVKVIVCGFDLLLLNGESLLETPLVERREKLRTYFKPVEHKFCFAVSHDGKELEDIEAFLNKAVEDKCEGLMIKAIKGQESFYQPARRSMNWLKLKKDYLNGLADSFDLVPIGAYFGKGKRTGTYGAYILAAYDEDACEFQSITKIGTGFSDKQLEEFSAFFKNHISDTKPSNYDCDMEPDVWFRPVQVWEVRAADLSISPVHRAAAGKVDSSKGIALRFPRFLRIRDDKTTEDATNATQVADMYLNQASVSKPSNADDDFF